jgi:quercetin dioxygenase-like cupin family protein
MNADNTAALDKIYDSLAPVMEPTFHFGAGHCLKIMTVPKDSAVRIHVHDYDHWSHVIVGGGRLMTDDEITHVRAGGLIFVKAGKRHAFYADADTVWVCVHKEGENE